MLKIKSKIIIWFQCEISPISIGVWSKLSKMAMFCLAERSHMNVTCLMVTLKIAHSIHYHWSTFPQNMKKSIENISVQIWIYRTFHQNTNENGKIGRSYWCRTTENSKYTQCVTSHMTQFSFIKKKNLQ